MALAGTTVLLNPSASDEILGKVEYRHALVQQQAARCLAAYLGREECTAGSWLSQLDMEKTTIELLRELGVNIPFVHVPVASLSGGQRQSIAVARSVLHQARIVLLDKPTAALGLIQTRQVLALIRRLRDQGLGVVLISHKLPEVFAVADRIVVLRLGKRVATFAVKDTTSEEVVAAITGATLGRLMNDSENESSAARKQASEPLQREG